LSVDGLEGEKVEIVFLINCDFIPTHVFLGQAYEQKAMYEEAIAELRRALTLSGGSPRYLAMLAHAYAAAGTRTQAIKILDKLRELSSEKYISPFEIGVVYAGLGEREHAFEWLEKAYEEHTTEIVTLKVESRLDILRSDPRFQDLMRRVGLPQ
jgi:tetratricopeptide (TPR) repeat protein